ncbi:hypothetical protein GOP47_0002435 [Adiantum capillus-veneris]|uniref:Uncharacterized protein n=1 Tax=Adiantum capillus-veneris TaxID=13818 RepID=A0A9D4VC31_ADICA|nr:hypothetical protein GOP47_0002435 [Adiantum capillus-veneris]
MAGCLLQHCAGSFLHHLHLRSLPRNGSVLLKDALQRLQKNLASYCGAPENQKQEEARIAERLVQAVSFTAAATAPSIVAQHVFFCMQLYMHRTLLCDSDAACYVKILQTLWEFEDQCLILRSSLINDLAVRALLEAHHLRSCRPAISAALHSMFITSSHENKGVLVETILREVYKQNDLLSTWNEAIIAGIGKSHMRLGLVELALLDRCSSVDAVMNPNVDVLVCCIKAAFSCISFNCDKIRQTVFEKLSHLRGHAVPVYIRFFQALAEIDKVDTIVYINLMIKLLREKKGLDMAVQTSLYSAIDLLKRRSAENVYKVPYFQVFSEKWLPTIENM